MKPQAIGFGNEVFLQSLKRLIGAAQDLGVEDADIEIVLSELSNNGAEGVKDLLTENTKTQAVKAKLSNDNLFSQRLNRFEELVETIQAFSSFSNLSSWDIETYLPKKASDGRAWASGILAKHIHEMVTSGEMGELLGYLRQDEVFKKLSFTCQKLVNEVTKNYEKGKKLPSEFVQELAKTVSGAYHVWKEAREHKDFSRFAETLEKIVALKRKETELVGYKGSPYNALVDNYEWGMTTEKLDKVFNDVKLELIPIIRKIKEANIKSPVNLSKKSFSQSKQIKIGTDILKLINFDLEAGRLDLAEHPFCEGVGPHDIRLTTRIFKNDPCSAIFSDLHEGGHGIYAQGIDEALLKTPLGNSPSLGIDESQSRLMENIIGRSLSFWTYYYPKFQEIFPKQLKDVSLDDFYKLINHVEPSLIRTEADEVTYNLHVILRYEIERDLIEGKLKVKDLPRVWNEKMQKYFGITPKNDALGVLQDGHWSSGFIGYFPTYTLGNIYAAQIYATAKKQIPNLEAEIEAGNMKPLTEWLKEKIYKHGRLLTTEEIIKQVTGEPLNAKYFIEYIKEKYGKIYGIKL